MTLPHFRKRLRVLLSLWATVCLVYYSASGQFEGVVVSWNSTTDETGVLHEFNMTMWIKGQMVKIEISEIGDSPGSTVIYRSDIGFVWILNDDDSTYFEVKKVAGVPDSIPRQIKGGEPGIEKTGKRKSILGYSSEQFLMRSDGTETEIWGTRDLAGLSAAIARGLGEDVFGTGGWTDELTQSGVFPLIAVTRVGSGIWESSEVTEIRREQLPAGFFTIPAGYTKQSVNQYFSDD
ncbi:MAG: DUF4412 domain-containing protein [Bacteroidota bacterium]